MKTLKSIFGRAYKVVTLFAVLVASALAYSCNSGLNGVSSSGKKEDGPGGVAGSNRAFISSVSLGDGERAIVPQGSFALKGEEIYKYVLKGTPVGGEETVLGTWVRTNDEDGYVVTAYDLMDNDLRGGIVALDPGTYTFSIQVYILATDGADFEAESDGDGEDAGEAEENAILVLEKTTDPIVVASGSNKIRFGVLNEASGNGKLSLKLSFPDEGVQSVVVRMDPQDEGNAYSVAEKSLEIGEVRGGYRSVVFNDDPVNGWYVVKFTFTINNGAGDTSQVFSELVQIATGRQTTADISIDNLNAIYPIVYNCKGGHLKADNIPLSYSPYQGAIPMPELAERNIATFDGWYSDPNFQNKVTQIPAGSKGAKTFYAKWKYNLEDGKFFACGEKAIIQQKEGTNLVYAYIDEVNPDNAILGDDGKLISISGWEVYGGCKPDGEIYPDGKTDDITIESGYVQFVYAKGNNGTITVNGGNILQVRTDGQGGTINVTGGKISGDYTNKTAIYTAGTDSTLNISGGTIEGNVRGNVAESTLVKVSGNPKIGNGKNVGIDLSFVKDKKIKAGNLDSAQDESITLLAPNASNDTKIATFEGANAYSKFFVVMNSNRKRAVKVADNGRDIVIEGGISLPTNLLVKDGQDNTYNLGQGNVTIPGTIFSVFAEDGYFNLTEIVVANNVHFDMGIPVDNRGKEQQFVYEADTEKFYRYIQFTSTQGEISGQAADDFLQSIEFHKIDNKPINIRINLETVPITGNGYTLNTDVFYLDGSFYKKSARFNTGGKSWPEAYNEAKAQTFNGLQGYLMTITSDAENKFVYDQIFKKEQSEGKSPDDFGSWIGGTRITPRNGYDASTWGYDAKLNNRGKATWNSGEVNDSWAWACGPEAGKIFYTKAKYEKDKNYRASGMYSSWSNEKDCALNGIEYHYKDDVEPNNGGNPITTDAEYYTQYTGRYVWNDGHEKGNGYSTSQGRWQIHYYIVEFRPYENTATGERYVSANKRLHAEQTYE